MTAALALLDFDMVQAEYQESSYKISSSLRRLSIASPKLDDADDSMSSTTASSSSGSSTTSTLKTSLSSTSDAKESTNVTYSFVFNGKANTSYTGENTTDNSVTFSDDDESWFKDQDNYTSFILDDDQIDLRNSTQLLPTEKEQPAIWPAVAIFIFVIAAVGLCAATAIKNYKGRRGGYTQVPAATSLVV
jgi:hypothetical protein